MFMTLKSVLNRNNVLKVRHFLTRSNFVTLGNPQYGTRNKILSKLTWWRATFKKRQQGRCDDVIEAVHLLTLEVFCGFPTIASFSRTMPSKYVVPDIL